MNHSSRVAIRSDHKREFVLNTLRVQCWSLIISHNFCNYVVNSNVQCNSSDSPTSVGVYSTEYR